MWDDTTNKLNDIEKGLVNDGMFIEDFDALSLSAVDLDGNTTSSMFTQTTTSLNGLSKLVDAISSILHEAYIQQQGAVIIIKSKMEICQRLSVSNSNYLRRSNQQRQNVNNSSKKENVNDSSKKELNTTRVNDEFTTIQWDNHTTQDDSLETSALVIKQDEEFYNPEWAQKQLRTLLQELHNNLNDILNTKLAAYEVVSSNMEIYVRSIVKIAYDNGVNNALEKAKYIIQPQLNNLLAHKFIDTSEVCKAKLTVL